MRASPAIALSLCVVLVSGCEPLENVIKATGANDSIGQMRQGIVYQSETPTDVTVAYNDIPPAIVQPEPVPDPVCEDVKFRYRIYDCHGNDTGRTYE